jgi:hypothetical protein
MVAEEASSAHFWKFLLFQYFLDLRRSNWSKAALQARQVALTLKMILTDEGRDACSELLLRGLSRGALQDGQASLAAEGADARERVMERVILSIAKKACGVECLTAVIA